jgi:hypothetical protein
VRVTDSALVSATAALSLAINPAALVITTTSLAAGTVGVAYLQTLGASGGSPPYSWSVAIGSLPAGLSLAPGGTILGAPGFAGSSSFTVRVTDSALVSATAALSLAINPAALGITTTSLAAGTVGVTYLQTLGASGGSPPYSWFINSGALPGGLNLNTTGTISGTPLRSGILAFSVQVTDSAGIKAAGTLTIQIQPSSIQIATLSLPASTVGASYAQTLTATGGSPPFSWFLSSGSLPPGLAVDPAGAIRGTATTAGSYTFSIQVADIAGASATMGYGIAINAAVSIETNSLADALIGAPYSQQLQAAGGTPPYAWLLVSGAPPDGIKVDSGGSLSGTPTVVGSFSFTVRAVDSVRAFAERQFQISTTPGLVITTAPLLAPATVGLQYGQALAAAGGRPPYVWSISSGGLPAGVTLNTATGALGGMPSAAGSFQFTVDASDSLARQASKQFSLPVAAAVVISSAPELPVATAGASYSQALAAIGGTPPYVWSIAAGGLPAGLSFDAGTATISGVPTLGGSFTFAAQVMDNNSVTTTKQFTLAVAISNLAITTVSPLPGATAGSSYALSLSATGGVPPYVWTVKKGSLPPGLALDPASNAIAGTPAAGGAFAFTLQVADAGGGSAIRDYTLAVRLPPLPSVSIDGLPDPSNAAGQPAFSVALATSYPVQLTGQIVMTFTADADVPIDDPSVQFATGGRAVNFTIPAGSTTAVFSTGQMALQTGTVSGTITLNLLMQAAGGEVTAAARTLHVPRAAPVVRTLQVVHTAAGFELHIIGYSTPRQLTQAVVQLTPSAGSNLQTTQLTIPLTDLAGSWYKSAASSPFGSQFKLVLPFTIQGNAAGIDSVGVSLVNSQGTSPAVSSKF